MFTQRPDSAFLSQCTRTILSYHIWKNPIALYKTARRNLFYSHRKELHAAFQVLEFYTISPAMNGSRPDRYIYVYYVVISVTRAYSAKQHIAPRFFVEFTICLQHAKALFVVDQRQLFTGRLKSSEEKLLGTSRAHN